jgi:hypothetical protein
MNIQTIDAQVWWIASADEIRPTEGWDPRQFLSAVAGALEFQDPPKALPDGAGTELIGGMYRNADIVCQITKVTLYNDGINVVVQGRTEVAEAVLRIILELAYDFGVRPPSSEPLQYFMSTIVADLSASLDDLFPKSILEKISAVTARNDAHFLSVGFAPDKTLGFKPMPGVTPTAFSIGRRLDVPFEQNRYFSQASSTTAAHVDLIAEFERLALKADGSAPPRVI